MDGNKKNIFFHLSSKAASQYCDMLVQCSCLENPRGGGAWWVAIYGVAQSWTRLRRLSSSSSSNISLALKGFILKVQSDYKSLSKAKRSMISYGYVNHQAKFIETRSILQTSINLVIVGKNDGDLHNHN